MFLWSVTLYYYLVERRNCQNALEINLDRSTQESMNVEVQSSAGAIIQHISECQPVVMECIEQTMKTPMTNLYELVYR